MKRCSPCFLALLLFFSSQQLSAQSTPFLSDEEIRMLSNEISGDRAFEHIRVLTRWHRNSGMEGYFKAADYVVETAKEAGLEDVRFIEQPLPGANYTARVGELWIVEPVLIKLADIGDHAVYLADNSHSADVTAELVWIADASQAAVEKVDVKGKIVLTSGSTFAAVQRAVWGKGALGVVSYQLSEGRSMLDFPDQIAWGFVPMPPEGKAGTFAFMLTPRKGETLRRMLETGTEQDLFATGKRVKGGRVVVKAKVETEIGKAPGRTGFVEGWIRGSKYHDQQIIVTAHLQEEQGSANDDGSGCGNLLELARALNKLIKEGKLKRPLRDIRFWWTDEIYSEYRYFQDHPDDVRNYLANIHQDMTGANQATGSRVQHLIFSPHSRTSYLDALFESIGTFVIQTNNGYLSASRQGGFPRPYTRPMYATRGTRQGYTAQFVPYFGSSDHMCFVEGAIGVPAVGMINWDDDYIHSSDDDLWQIDATQLKRNNFIIGGMATFLAFAEADRIPTIVGETYAQGLKRLANDMKVAMQMIQEGKGKGDVVWKEATTMVEQGIVRELRAVRSAQAFGRDDKAAGQTIDEFSDRVKRKESELMADLRSYYKRVHGSDPKSVKLTAEEQEASKKVPVNVASLTDYFGKRNVGAPPTSLHGLMRAEVFNYVDGKRSYYDIYKGVFAQANAAGSWYYGTVSLGDVVKTLDAAVKAGGLTIK
jgi:hypothetical protein